MTPSLLEATRRAALLLQRACKARSILRHLIRTKRLHSSVCYWHGEIALSTKLG